MIDQLKSRVDELKAEYKSGSDMLVELEARQTELRNTLMRISGAIQALGEEIAKAELDTEAKDE